MTTNWNRLLLVVCVASFFSLQASAKPKAPQWLSKAAETATPQFETGETPEIIVLWDEGKMEYRKDGSLSATYRYAIRVIEPQGSNRARAYASYTDGSSKVTNLKAWVVDPKGEVYAFKNREVSDIARLGYSLYSERRAKIIDGEGRSRVGTVFGYEYTREEKNIFTQTRWWFQSRVPVALSRLEVSAPEGWSISGRRFHGAPEATVSGNRYTWEARKLEAVEQEPFAPSRSLGRSFVSVDVRPSEGESSKYANLAFEDWEDLANFTAETHDRQMEPSSEIVSKTRELTADAPDDWSKIRAIGNYVKELRYASIQMDLGAAGGYIPRSAAETFAVGYGDCKDKANLLRSMLQVVGITAYPIVVNATDNDSVYPEWPSPHYFNHCIAVVELEESMDLPAAIEDEELGRLLFVDATSSLTPIGELPASEQGGLVVMGKHGMKRLLRLPEAPPRANGTRRNIEAELLPDGAMVGVVVDRLRGSAANKERALRMSHDESEYESSYSRWVSNGNSSAATALRRVEDNEDGDRSFEVEFEFWIPGYGKSMRDRLLVFKPAILSRRDENPFTEPTRSAPIRFSPGLLEEESMIYFPPGFKLDDRQDSIVIESEFARYALSFEPVEEGLLFKRSVKFEGVTVEAEEYAKVQAFYRSMIEADQTPVVLARTEG